ncbi:hypothetical protein CDG77_22110 [Nostoc sp. 'Peltigera membranacea cyanobiont' 213]|uniref:hypothetical protein n=1 Tax=unclassified Nostoc TaxID=2593658 RepID=UPI000B950463|nr:hypothetical protein [Nostoc sp. 'Peltigera membranacea cyanobiont' 213]OYD88715.1 hypothetical protein CDG77_22110 [Nostoc sp. 'Peltigera membranacea cyanobiont' 213]
MSEKLRNLLEKHQDFKKLNNLLSSCSSMMFVDNLADSESPSPITIWKKIAGFDINPTQKIAEDVPLCEVSVWFQERLWELNISKEIYISIGGLSGLSWAKVKILSQENWLLHIWKHGNYEIVVLNDRKNKAICLLKEEYFWELYILSI